MAVPRGADGHFLPPQYRLDSVPARDLDVGDRVTWNIDGQARMCEVVERSEEWGFGIKLKLKVSDGTFYCPAVLLETDTLNRVEVLW